MYAVIESPIHAYVYPIIALFSNLRKSLRESYVSCFVIMLELQINTVTAFFFFRRGEIFRNRSLTLSLSMVSTKNSW